MSRKQAPRQVIRVEPAGPLFAVCPFHDAEYHHWCNRINGACVGSASDQCPLHAGAILVRLATPKELSR